MDNADLYHRANDLQRRDAKDVIDEYIHLVKWRREGCDRILDIGCGDGNVMMDILRKHFPGDYAKVTGVDISAKMIEYASLLYADAKTDFKVMDISADVDDKFVGQFDHIFSFNCLHWVQDQRTAMSNIYAMLKPGGDCILAMGAKNLIYDVYKILEQNPKWSPYMKDLRKYISPYNESVSPADECKKYLQMAGFKNAYVEYKRKTYYFNSVNILKKSVFAVDPFIAKMPAHLHDAYFEDYLEQVKKFDLIEDNNNNNLDDVKIRTPYYSLIVNATK